MDTADSGIHPVQIRLSNGVAVDYHSSVSPKHKFSKLILIPCLILNIT